MAEEIMVPTDAVGEVEVVDVALGDTWGVRFEVEALGVGVIEMLEGDAGISHCQVWGFRSYEVERRGRGSDVGCEEEAEKEEECSVDEGLEVFRDNKSHTHSLTILVY